MPEVKDCPDGDCPVPSTSTTPAVAAPPASNLLKPNTFSPPVLDVGAQQEELPRVVIEFCDRCRWLHRAVWTQTELFLTFPPTTTNDEGVVTATGIKAITLVPRSAPDTAGRFRVWLYRSRTIEEEFEQTEGKEAWGSGELVWDRKVEGSFPELKILKQRIRNLINPQQDLGHSDKGAFAAKETAPAKVEEPAGTSGAEPAPEVDDYTPRFRC